MSGEGIIAADIERRGREVADIVAGLAGPEGDRWFWKNKARSRIYCLTEDGKVFGLLPHEEREIEQLEAALAASGEAA